MAEIEEEMILILSTTQGNGWGAEKVLCELLNAWDDSMPLLAVTAPKNSLVFDCATKNRIETIALPSRRDSLAFNLLALGQVLKKLPKCQLVHAWSARSFELAYLIGLSRGIMASGTLHDHPCAVHHGILRRRLIKHSASKFKSLACVSDAVVHECQKEGYECPLKVTHNGLQDVAVEKHIDSASVRIGFLGMYASWKGFPIVADWIERLRDENVVWSLYGTILPEFESKALKLEDKYGERVLLKGRQKTEEIFKEIDVLVHASTAFDPLPTVLIEAARAEIPVLASTLGGAKEIVDDGNTGLLFATQDVENGYEILQRLVDSAELRSALGTNARRRYKERFTSRQMAETYGAFWASIA